MMRDFHSAGMRADLHGMGEVDLRGVLPTITVPTLLLYGDADVRSPVSVAEDLHARIPTSTLVVIPGAPHLRTWNNPTRSTRRCAASPITCPSSQRQSPTRVWRRSAIAGFGR